MKRVAVFRSNVLSPDDHLGRLGTLPGIDLNPLLTNIAIAGALCAAFNAGKRWQWDEDVRPRHRTKSQKPRHNHEWFPGCGRPVP